MFTVVTICGLASLAWYAERSNIKDRSTISQVSDAEARQSVLHARQDIRLVAYLLAGILIMLGVVADRLP